MQRFLRHGDDLKTGMMFFSLAHCTQWKSIELLVAVGVVFNSRCVLLL
jgi:hypothetical protein